MTATDAEKWSEAVKQCGSEAYFQQIAKFADHWATAMENEIARGEKLEDVAESLSFVSDVATTQGITISMYQSAVVLLSEHWVHGQELLVWHNRRFGIMNETERIYNCSVIGGQMGTATIVGVYRDLLEHGVAAYETMRKKAKAEIILNEIRQHYKKDKVVE